MLIFHCIFLSNYWWQKSDIWSPASYRYPISWEAFLDQSDSYFLFADFVDFYTDWTYILYMPIFCRIFLSNYWWQKSDIWSQAFFDPSDSYFLIAEERGYHKWALAHSSSCYFFNGSIVMPLNWKIVNLWFPCSKLSLPWPKILKICTQCFCFQYTCQVIMPFMVPELCPCLLLLGHLCPMRRRRGRDRMVVGFTTIYAIGTYHH
jgi:hypothetical protein